MHLHEIVVDSWNTPEAAVRYITKNCKPWFARGGGWHEERIVYRGQVSSLPTTYYVKPVRSDRRAMNMNAETTDMFNAAISRAGLVANRNNSVFCSGDRTQALDYGFVYVMFPIGRFNFTWSGLLEDWYTKMDRLNSKLKMDLDFVVPKSEKDLKKLDQELKLRGDDNSLLEAIASEHEILIHCQEVLLINESFYFGEVLPLISES